MAAEGLEIDAQDKLIRQLRNVGLLVARRKYGEVRKALNAALIYLAEAENYQKEGK